MSDRKFKLPECGMYFGSSVYLGMEDYTAGLGKMFTTWIPQNYLPESNKQKGRIPGDRPSK